MIQAQLPFAAGDFEFLGKWGSVRSSKPLGIRAPFTFCWPTQAIICDMLILEPLDPQRAITQGALVRGSSDRQAFPASSRIYNE